MINIEDNAVLRRLSPEALAILTPALRSHDLPVNQVICEIGQRVDTVWFPTSALISLITSGTGGETVETSMVGADAAHGLIEALGSGHCPYESVVQIDGAAFSAPAQACRQAAQVDPAFSGVAWRIAEYQLIEARQTALCQAHHAVEQRLARWLVDTVDRIGAQRLNLPLTQEFMAAMLGVQRTTVSAFASQLQKHGLIRYSRGKVLICDLEGLSRRACECRDVIRDSRERLGLTPPLQSRAGLPSPSKV